MRASEGLINISSSWNTESENVFMFETSQQTSTDMKETTTSLFLNPQQRQNLTLNNSVSVLHLTNQRRPQPTCFPVSKHLLLFSSFDVSKIWPCGLTAQSCNHPRLIPAFLLLSHYVFSPESVLIGALCSLYKIAVKRKRPLGKVKVKFLFGKHSCLALTSHLCQGQVISQQGSHGLSPCLFW